MSHAPVRTGVAAGHISSCVAMHRHARWHLWPRRRLPMAQRVSAPTCTALISAALSALSLHAQVPEVAVTGDTTMDFARLPTSAAALRARLLIIECTFLDDDIDPADARARGHMHVRDLAEHADLLQVRPSHGHMHAHAAKCMRARAPRMHRSGVCRTRRSCWCTFRRATRQSTLCSSWTRCCRRGCGSASRHSCRASPSSDVLFSLLCRLTACIGRAASAQRSSSDEVSPPVQSCSAWRNQRGCYSMAATAWLLQHGCYGMAATAWLVQHGWYSMAATVWHYPLCAAQPVICMPGDGARASCIREVPAAGDA
jgi:hypothetical protein